MPKLGQKKLLTDDQVQRARKAFSEGLTRDQVAFAIGITRAILDARLRDQLADVKTGQGGTCGRSRRRIEDPTPEEMQARIAEVHARRLRMWEAGRG